MIPLASLTRGGADGPGRTRAPRESGHGFGCHVRVLRSLHSLCDYKDYGGNVGQGKVNKLTDLSGYLYFSDAANDRTLVAPNGSHRQ
jgi:hypothetical protein